jgi:hypothetical protein
MRSAVRERQVSLHAVDARDRDAAVAHRASLQDVARQKARLGEADGAPCAIYLRFAGHGWSCRHARPCLVGRSVARACQPHTAATLPTRHLLAEWGSVEFLRRAPSRYATWLGCRVRAAVTGAGHKPKSTAQNQTLSLLTHLPGIPFRSGVIHVSRAFGRHAGWALSLGMLSAVLPLGRRREDVELAPLFEVEFFDVGGPVIDLEPTH